MRLIVETLIALLLVGLLGSVLFQQGSVRERQSKVVQTHHAIKMLYDQTLLQRAMTEAHTGKLTAPDHISPMWFEDELPINAFLPHSQPWIDIAPPGDMNDHPPDPVVTRSDQAGFWYNPERRLFRARVPEYVSDSEALRLYNELNGTSLTALMQDESAARKTRANAPWTEPAAVKAANAQPNRTQ